MPSFLMRKIIKMQKKTQLETPPILDASLINKAREENERMSKLFKVPGKISRLSFEIDGIPAELLTPRNSKAPERILYLHGGGYCLGSINTHRALAARISINTGIPALLINYRLAPEHTYPAALEDALQVYRWLLDEEKIKPKNIFVGGDSAGGGLAVALLLRLKELGLPMPRATLLMSPWVDLTCSGESMQTRVDQDPMILPESLAFWGKSYVGDNDAENPLISPLFGSLEGLPPVFLLVGTAEILYNDTSRLATKLEKSGVPVELREWEEQVHVFPLLGSIKFIGRFLPECRKALDQITAFIQTQRA